MALAPSPRITSQRRSCCGEHFDLSVLPTIWDRLAAAGLEGRYYFSDLPFLALWGAKYVPLARPIGDFFADALVVARSLRTTLAVVVATCVLLLVASAATLAQHRRATDVPTFGAVEGGTSVVLSNADGRSPYRGIVRYIGRARTLSLQGGRGGARRVP
jgi:hypothetical protein